MDLKPFADFIQQQGFAVFVAVWLLVQFFSMHADNIKVQTELIVEIKLLRVELTKRPAS